ncbi:reverse transcriptase, partial [Cooperia oncophora]
LPDFSGAVTLQDSPSFIHRERSTSPLLHSLLTQPPKKGETVRSNTQLASADRMPKRQDRLRICTMNVRSIATAARLADFEAAVENVKFDVIGVSETRMAGKGRIDLSSGYSLYHSGTEERTKRGVGFYVPSSLNQHSDCFFHSERMIELCIKLADRSTLRIIQVHAPHSDFQDVEYEAFLDNLAHVLDARRSKHQVILGDFNATPGLRRNEERYIGNNSSGARNHRGQMLADFCEERKLFLANSFFKKRLDDRWTWRNDALGLKKEIDYVLLRSMKGVVDVGVLTSVNTGSDHRMLRCKMRLNPISQPVRRPRGFPVIDSDLLITRVITTATQMSTRYEYLPPRLSPRTRDLLQRRRELRHGDNGRGIVEYAEICKLARKSIQEDLRQRHIQIFRQAIKSGRLRRGRMQALHARRSLTILKETTSSPPSDPSPSDEPFPDHVSQSVKAVRNFYNALYHSSFGPPTPPSGQINLQVHNNEVQMAMKRSKARSAAGSDGIQSPSLRALSQILALPITHFFNNMIRTKVVPATTIEEKSILPPEQAGFRKHFSTIDHIHTINMITEKCHEFNIELCAVFVDFKKAFDSVELPMIWKALEYFGVEENLIMAIQLLYAHSTAAVRIANQLAEFNLQRGVRQGDSMSPVLFTLVLQYALNLIDWQGKGLKLGNKTLSYLAYADDIIDSVKNNMCSIMYRNEGDEEKGKGKPRILLLLKAALNRIVITYEGQPRHIVFEKGEGPNTGE